jgi:thiamine-monophosphate kinase
MLDTPNQEKTQLSELGEFALINRLTSSIKLSNKSTLEGVGDDAAIINHSGYVTLVSKDLLVEGVHFDLSYVPLKHLGYKAVVVNISDIYAMNGIPTQIIVGLGVSNRFPVEALEEIYEGMLLACNNYKVDLVGGDTTSSASGMMLSITAIGKVKKGNVVKRSGAKPKDLLVVSGDLGSAYMGLQVLEREKAAFKSNPNLQPELQGHEYVLERQLKPEARKDIIDGLSSEIMHLCKSSDLGCTIYEDKIPMDPQMIRLAEEFGINPITAVLNGGEDYELLFTISLGDYDKIKHNPSLTAIGHMTDSKPIQLITNAEQAIELEAQGWKAF